MMSNTMSFSTFVNGNYVRINHHIGKLYINKVSLNFPHHICSMSLSPDKLFVAHSNIRLDGFHTFEDGIPKNNIEAYDFSGNLVWQIKDIWENSKTMTEAMKTFDWFFCYVSWHNGQSLSEYFPNLNSKWNSLSKDFKVDFNHEYLECHSIAGPRFVIDLTEGEAKWYSQQ